MSLTIMTGWWLLPLAVSIAAVWWCERQDYSGDYNFTAVFTVPMTGFVICLAWMIYFGLGWALA